MENYKKITGFYIEKQKIIKYFVKLSNNNKFQKTFRQIFRKIENVENVLTGLKKRKFHKNVPSNI